MSYFDADQVRDVRSRCERVWSARQAAERANFLVALELDDPDSGLTWLVSVVEWTRGWLGDSFTVSLAVESADRSLRWMAGSGRFGQAWVQRRSCSLMEELEQELWRGFKGLESGPSDEFVTALVGEVRGRYLDRVRDQGSLARLVQGVREQGG